MIPLLLPCVAAASSYAAYISLTSITNVRKYEEQTKQAAKISDTAADQLHSTRTTEAAGALSAALSLVTSLAFTLYPSESPKLHLALAAFNVGALAFAADHISRFWTGKLKVPAPGLGKYNDAITLMDSLRRTLLVLALAWTADLGVGLWGVVRG